MDIRGLEQSLPENNDIVLILFQVKSCAFTPTCGTGGLPAGLGGYGGGRNRVSRAKIKWWVSTRPTKLRDERNEKIGIRYWSGIYMR